VSTGLAQKASLDMHDDFVDPCLPLTLAPLPRRFCLWHRLYLGMMLECFVLVTVAIYLRLALGNAHSYVRASFWLPLIVMAPKVAETLRQRYAECRAASEVFSRPNPNMALYMYNMSTTSKVMYSVRGFFGVPKETGSVTTPTGLIFFPLKL
jgi:hypothetical protein